MIGKTRTVIHEIENLRTGEDQYKIHYLINEFSIGGDTRGLSILKDMKMDHQEYTQGLNDKFSKTVYATVGKKTLGIDLENETEEKIINVLKHLGVINA